MNITFRFTVSGKDITLTVLYNMQPYTYTPESHSDFYGLVQALREYTAAYQAQEPLEEKEDAIAGFLKPEYLRQVAETNPELRMEGGQIYYGEHVLSGVLVERIATFRSLNLPYEPYWNFLRKVMANPDERSREQLYVFLENNEFPPITMDGDFLAYKGLNEDWTSIHQGYGIVDGIEYTNAHLPNEVGSVVTMPRHKVNSNPDEGCSYGLHVGSLEYVRNFARGKMVVVKVNPRDVVSVPKDSSYQKVRTCKYEVVAEFTDEIKDIVNEDFSESNAVKDVMLTLTEGVENAFHLANRTVNKLHPTATGQERAEYFQEYVQYAKEVLGAEEEDEDHVEYRDNHPTVRSKYPEGGDWQNNYGHKISLIGAIPPVVINHLCIVKELRNPFPFQNAAHLERFLDENLPTFYSPSGNFTEIATLIYRVCDVSPTRPLTLSQFSSEFCL